MAERAQDKLFLDDKEIAARLGVRAAMFPSIAQVLEKDGFPRRDPLFEDKRYWPACRSYLDRRQGVRQDDDGALPLNPDGKENWS
ncbi:hypothetical protein NS365_04710 [Aureimonas ureilytica]|uniref:Winged helix-turn-helix domain-containing protein n=1 Tax=Aureimonas ureilytica TaxID=401562 RepID=A0A175R300_9HYPH|nr:MULTISPECIES: hypothetical protein [Aureimonas]KTQ85103.1 hypothetical protein NS226_21185 [Aureimonas ureilytica]KTR07358.1 hypothetical protein NS365_04710 [Aureimonas ureilytica]